MDVFRICLSKYAGALVASGIRGRWNLKGAFVIYTAGSRALACLENVVHRSGEGLTENFRTLIIDIPETLAIEVIPAGALPPDWKEISSYPACQALAQKWYAKGDSAVLKVPSAIIPEESNYILNSRHPGFSQIRIKAVEDFFFDPRIKDS